VQGLRDGRVTFWDERIGDITVECVRLALDEFEFQCSAKN
jgi:hypothetical protein